MRKVMLHICVISGVKECSIAIDMWSVSTVMWSVSLQTSSCFILRVVAGVKEYSTAIDMWSLGCIMGELIQNKPLLPGKSEMEQIHKIFSLVGTPTAENWPKHTDLPNLNKVSIAPCWVLLLELLH